MIDHDAAADLWERYNRGERNVFTARQRAAGRRSLPAALLPVPTGGASFSNGLVRLKSGMLRNRHDKEYYRTIVANAKKDVRVMGASCTRFMEDFLDVRSDDKVLVDALRMNPTLTVRLLTPQKQYMTEAANARSQEVGRLLTALTNEFDKRIELRRFGHKPAHSFVIVDNDLVAGPIFESDKSKYTPAVHVAMSTDFARKYSEHFDEIWQASGI
jgi:hypothetical protein